MKPTAHPEAFLLQDYGPRLAPYAEALRASAFAVGGFRLGACCSISASWCPPQGPRYLLTLEATDGVAAVRGNLAMLPGKKSGLLRWLFQWMLLDAPADLARLLMQCEALAEAQRAAQPPPGRDSQAAGTSNATNSC